MASESERPFNAYQLPKQAETFLLDWRSVIVADGIKQKLVQYIDTLIRLAAVPAQSLGLRRALLLYGPPGCGKTSLARGLPAFWQQQRSVSRVLPPQVGFVHVNTHALFSGVRGGGQEKVLGLFRDIAELATTGQTILVLIDEVETLGSDRSTISLEANPLDALYQVTAFFESLDRCVKESPNVIFLLTTNIPRAIDRAVRERVDFAIEIPLPGEQHRHRILQDAVSALSQAYDVDGLLRQSVDGDDGWSSLVKRTEGFSGRSLRHVAVLAATHAATSAGLSLAHLEQAVTDTLTTEESLLASGGIYVESYQEREQVG